MSLYSVSIWVLGFENTTHISVLFLNIAFNRGYILPSRDASIVEYHGREEKSRNFMLG